MGACRMLILHTKLTSYLVGVISQRALTPIIAGSISGGCVVIAWIIALATYLFKRYRKKKRYKKFGRPDLVDENPKAEVFIVPPDPAVIQGQRQPGEHVFIDKKHGGKGKEKERGREGGEIDI